MNVHLAQDTAMVVYLCMYAKEFGVKCRDLIINMTEKNYGYRNNGVYVFNGKRIVNLDYTKDDYGAIPSEFSGGCETREDVNLYQWIDGDTVEISKYEGELSITFE